ncbi:HNH endonuclease [Streptomyces sp. NPDC006283]|uniref:HNH endonuclease n=1 Tax=Streptomyces sp. NPDC006283 TaxID=3156741 RepID=UPI0033B05041
MPGHTDTTKPRHHGGASVMSGGRMAGRKDLTEYGYRKARARFLAESDVCHICGHPAADTIDHLTPVSRGGSTKDQDNWAPAHGVKGCPTCGRKCNGEKSNKPAAAVNRLVTSRDWYSGP